MAQGPPSVEQIASLTESFRRDPSAFVDLGAALLTLGRPRDAIEVGARGLKANPSDINGRLMVARAFASLHQWKEAQAELLKVVKADRNHGDGFRLLGEVLMRRADYERALPVLQHAQNLSPADPSVLSLLRRARAGQSLDPPAPIPTPLQPASSGPRAPAVPDVSPGDLDAMPTRVAPDAYAIKARASGSMPAGAGALESGSMPAGAGALESGSMPAAAGALGRVELERRELVREGPKAPIDRVRRDGRTDDRDAEAARPVEIHKPPPPEDPYAQGMPPDVQLGGMPDVREKRPSAAPPPGVRPRVIGEKPIGEAQRALRQSAAVGEQYLNSLLTAGLLDVPNVRVAPVNYDVTPDKRWGRSAKRMFIYLFVIMFMGIGGGGTWYWYAEKQKAEDVARLLANARALIDSGDYADLAKAAEESRAAIRRDKEYLPAIAVFSEVAGLQAILYREINASEVSRGVGIVSKEIKKPTAVGYRELLVAKTSIALSELDTLGEEADGRLADTRRELKSWLETSPDDNLVRWLSGRALMLAGDRTGAKVAFEKAYARGEGPVVAGIDWADALLDEGKYDEAKKLYDAVLRKSPKHPLAFLGRSLARSESNTESSEAMSDLNVGLAEGYGPRVEAYKRLALATARFATEDFVEFKADVAQAVGVQDPRFLARVALLRIAQGELQSAAAARTSIRWYAEKPQPHPLVKLVDAELFLARGLPDAALAEVGKDDGLHAAKLRGRALLDSNQPAEALIEFQAALETSPDDLEAKVWAEAAKMVALSGDDRSKADKALDKLGRQAKSKSAKYVHGWALLATGQRSLARTKLEQSIDDLSDEFPNHLAYRSHVSLAQLSLAEGKTDQAIAHARKAVEQNGGYLPAHDILGRLLVATNVEEARQHLIEVVNAEVASLGAELAYIKSIMPSKAKVDIEAATAAINRAKSKGASVPQLQEVIPLVDPALFETWGIEPPNDK